MTIRTAFVIWNGNLKEGNGRMKLGSGAFDGPFSFQSRFEEGTGTNPEELIGAAQAGCFSMFLAAVLSGDGFTPTEVKTTAKVHLGEGPTVSLIELDTQANVPDLDEGKFQEKVEFAKKNCPISKALTGLELRVTARLVK